MALSRLIQPKSGLRVDRYRFPKPVRWVSSESSDAEIDKVSQTKKTVVPSDKKSVAVETFVKEYMETNSGVYPKVVHIQNELSGSWYTVKKFFNDIKEKMLGNTQSENHHKIDASTLAKQTVASTVMATPSVPDSGIELCGHQESAFGADQDRQGEDKEGNIDYSKVAAEGECSSGFTVSLTSSYVTDMHNSSSSSEHDKLNSTGCLDQQENKTTYSLSPNSSVQMSTKSAMSAAFQKATRLSNLFKFVSDEEVSDSQQSLLGKRQDLHVNTLLSSLYENQQPGMGMVASNERQGTIAELFNGSKNLMGLEDMKGLNNQASGSITNNNRDISMHSVFWNFEEPMQKNEAKSSEIKGLIDCIKGLPIGSSTARDKQKISSSKIDESSKESQWGIQSMATFQSYDKKEKNKSFKYHALCRESNHDGSSKVSPASLRTQADKTSSPGFAKPTGHTQHSVLTGKQDSHEIQHKMGEAGENKAVVKFLYKDANKSDIVRAFENCGDILKVEFSSPERAFYRNADIHFKTREGLQNALIKTDIIVKNAHITVQAAATGEDISNRITIPRLIGDPNVPAALVKNPRRTVKITQLTKEISSTDFVAALESWGNNVTGFFFGKLDSVAFVEFEEEDQKEAVLAKHSIDVLGKRLLISRIDAPRTTVVRISFRQETDLDQILVLCNSLGKTLTFRTRKGKFLDVYFKIAEWPNMLKILNRLNGVKVDGHKLQAQPAHVIPPQILQVLWRQPEERLYVKNVVQRLLQKLGENVVHKADLADLSNFYED